MPATPQHRRLLGGAVRAKRKELKFSQEKLVEKADLSTVSISRAERGRGSPAVDSLVKIALPMKVRLRDLVVDV